MGKPVADEGCPPNSVNVNFIAGTAATAGSGGAAGTAATATTASSRRTWAPVSFAHQSAVVVVQNHHAASASDTHPGHLFDSRTDST